MHFKDNVRFKELLNIEAQVRGVNKYSPKEIKALFRTHPEDFTPAIEACFFDLKDSGRTFRLVLLEEVEDEPETIDVSEVQADQEKAIKLRDPLAIKRQLLALNIKNYAIQVKKTPDELVQAIYTKYKIKSRTELTGVELDHEIKLHRPFSDEELREHG